MNHVKASMAAGVMATLLLGTGGCAPGSSSSISPSTRPGAVSSSVGSGDITLTVWDQNTDGGMNDAQTQLNAAFEKKYPNVKIKRVAESFSDLKQTLKLAISGNNPPDVVQANQGYPDMGTFVKDGLLLPEDDYARLYGWNTYYPSSLLNFNRFSADGKTWQTGHLYGVSQTGEFVGVFYNKKKLDQLGLTPPKTLDQLTSDMAAAKKAGTLPMSYGDLDKDPGIHIYGLVQAAIAGKTPVSNLVTGKSGAWTDAANVKAAQTVQGWAKAGYLTPGANGVSKDKAAADFAAGKSLFLTSGTWDEATIEHGLGTKGAGVVALEPAGSTTPVTEGGEGLAWSITSKSKHQNAAAAYINFITNTNAAKKLLATGNLPAVLPAGYKAPAGTLAHDIDTQYSSLSASNGIVPYLDYTTPTFYNTLTAAAQNLTAEKVTPNQFATTLQADYAAFLKDRK